MKATLLKLYLFVFFDDFMLIYPFYMLMFEDLGISPVKMSLLLTILAATYVLMEVPSGALADKYSRKWVIAWGQLIRFVGYGFWLFMPNFTGFMIGFIAWGIKEAITSGTFEALLFDELKECGRDKEFTKILGRVKATVFTAVFLAAMISAVLIKWGYKPVLIGSIISVGLSGIFMMILPETKRYKTEDRPSFVDIFRDGVRYSVKKKRVLILLTFLALTFGLAGSLEEFWPLIGKELGFLKKEIAVIFGFVFIAMAFGSTVAHRFEKLRIDYLYIFHLLAGFSALAAGLIFTKGAIVFIILFFLIHQIVHTTIQGKLQRMIPSRIRATISSMNGFLGGAAAIILFPVFGSVSQSYNYRIGLIIFALLVIIHCLPYCLITILRKSGK